MDILLTHIKCALITYKKNKDLVAQIQRCQEKYTLYYQHTDNLPFYAAALVLHPTYYMRYIKANWKKAWQTPALQKVKKLQEQYKETHQAKILYDYIGSNLLQEQEPLNKYDQILKGLRSNIRVNKDEDKYDNYCSEASYDI